MKKLFFGAFAFLAGAGSGAVFDFEDGVQGWRLVEGGCGRLLSERDTCYAEPGRVEDGRNIQKQGKRFLTTGEDAKGRFCPEQEATVVSPVVKMTGSRIEFLSLGGDWRSSVELADAENGRVYKRSRRGGYSPFAREVWDVPEAKGRKVVLRLRDVTDWIGGGFAGIDDVKMEGDVLPEESAKYVEAQRLAAKRKVKDVTAASLRAGIEARRGVAGYPADELLGRVAKRTDAEWADDPVALNELAREALVRKDPRIGGNLVLFAARNQFLPDHHNTATIFQKGEINWYKQAAMRGTFKLLDMRTGETRVVFDPGPGGMVRDPEMDYDGRTVVFSMRRSMLDDYHIYTAKLEGVEQGIGAVKFAELRQLTRAEGVSDIDPAFLPDGRIVFSSTRDPKYCMCNRHIMCNLYRMERDGANIVQIGKSTLFEGHSTVLPDGRILYDRWEYVDRNFGDAQGLWTCNPDGTGHAIFWGNNTTSPGGVIDARALDGNRVIAVLAACHDRPRGALGIIDRSLGVDGKKPVVKTWPEGFRERIKEAGQDYDSTGGMERKYEDPYPLDAGHFLATHRLPGCMGSAQDAIYMLDLLGNEVMVHREADTGCYDAIPVRARAKEHVHAERRNYESPKAPGRFYLQNVYEGTHMEGVKPGTVKWLRVVESPEKRNWSGAGWGGQGEQAAAMNWHNFENKRILGTVPVEEDGSAYFEAPGNTFVFFQALDGEGRMVQTMRSGAYVQPGELYGCVGCHEDRVNTAPRADMAKPLAMRKAPAKLEGWHGPARKFSFQREIQPIFDRKCTSCHDYGKKAGEKLNLAGDRDLVFCASYMDLWSKGVVNCVGAGNAEILQPYTWGSVKSKLTQKVRAGHGGLTAEEIGKLETWVDINAPYYPCYESAYPMNKGGRCPVDGGELARLQQLTGAKIGWGHHEKPQAWVSFERPEESRILKGLKEKDEAAWKEAVGIIRRGAQRLAERPRADMEDFVPNPEDLERLMRYWRRENEEARVYKAIREGKKVFDK